MSMRILAPCLAAFLLLAQARARRLPVRGGADAGVGIAVHVERDGGPSDGGAAPTSDDLAELRRDVSTLKTRTQALERDSQRARDQDQLLQRLSDQVQSLRQELAQDKAQDKAQKQAREDEQAARRDETQQAMTGLAQVQNAMAGGSADVDRALVSLRSSLPPAAQRDVDAAREALRNRDLAAARALVAQAMMDAQAR